MESGVRTFGPWSLFVCLILGHDVSFSVASLYLSERVMAWSLYVMPPLSPGHWVSSSVEASGFCDKEAHSKLSPRQEHWIHRAKSVCPPEIHVHLEPTLLTLYCFLCTWDSHGIHFRAQVVPYHGEDFWQQITPRAGTQDELWPRNSGIEKGVRQMNLEHVDVGVCHEQQKERDREWAQKGKILREADSLHLCPWPRPTHEMSGVWTASVKAQEEKSPYPLFASSSAQHLHKTRYNLIKSG